ncbi:hypothetical protein V6N13_123316 [Hibiscus sabdariffa]
MFLSWNVRGLGSRVKRASVKKVIKRLQSGVIFFQESKLSEVGDRVVNQLCGMGHCFSIVFAPSVGGAGGLISIWDCSCFSLKSSIISTRFIILIGKILSIELKCALINIYAPNDHRDRANTFNELTSILSNVNLHVLIGGNFNIVRSLEEKGGVSFNSQAMEEFSLFINNLGLVDLPLSGDLIQELQPKSLSDHNAITLSIFDFEAGPKPFKWFDYWAEKEWYEEVINSVVFKAMEGIGSVLRSCKACSKQWVQSVKQKDSEPIHIFGKKCDDLEKKIQCGGSCPKINKELITLRASLWNRHCANTILSLKFGEKILHQPEEIKKACANHFISAYSFSATLPVERLDCAIKKVSSFSASLIE